MSQTSYLVDPPLDWQPVAAPRKAPLRGVYVTLVPLNSEIHGASLFEAKGDDPDLWRYTLVGLFDEFAPFQDWLRRCEAPDDPLFFAIIDNRDSHAKGMASYLRITPEHGVIEIGSIWFGPEIQRTRQATEAIYLLARHVFDDLGYRRLEWKCHGENIASRRAAARFGFTFEGQFRQHVVAKGRNRDTAWFSLLDHEWPGTRAAFEAWLLADNFDSAGRQKSPLKARRAAS